MLCAKVAFKPDTRASKGAEAVFTSTPTAFTQSSTTASKLCANCTWLTSCWYWPTPMDFGSIFTNSANGSCKRRAIDTAPRKDTSKSGNSFAANSDAEYTEAPASDTTNLCTPASGIAFITSAANWSVSRLAVPLPMAINCTPCCLIKRAKLAIAPCLSLRGWNGYTVSVANSLPVSSTTATFTPVRMPGSRPKVTKRPAGAANSKSFKLRANTVIAAASPSVLMRLNASNSKDKNNFARQVRRTVSLSHLSAARFWSAMP